MRRRYSVCKPRARWRATPSLPHRPIAPVGGQRGTELDVVIAGARLGDAQELLLYYPGIRATKVEAQKNGAVNAHLAIAADCRLGLHALRLRTSTGISNLVTFSVGALPEIQESEPNNDFDNPQKIPLNVTANGTVENEDVDYFVVEAKKGQRIATEIEGLRLGDDFSPCVTIWTRGGSCWPRPTIPRLADSVCHRSPHLIRCAASGNAVPTGCTSARFPAAGRPIPGGILGQTAEVRWLGDLGGEWSEKVSLPNVSPPMFGLVAKTAGGLAPSANPFRLGRLTNAMESEPNDAPAQSTPFEAPAALNGIVGQPGDVDTFKFTAKAGQVSDIRVHARSIRSPLDSVLEVGRITGRCWPATTPARRTATCGSRPRPMANTSFACAIT